MSLYFYILTQERNRLKHSKEMEINMEIIPLFINLFILFVMPTYVVSDFIKGKY